MAYPALRRPETAAPTTPDPVARRGERAARWAIALWALLWIVHDSLPYVGGRDDSCQTMFSSLEWGVAADGSSWNNHLVVPQHMLFDAWVNVELGEVVIDGELRDARERALARWLSREGRDRNVEALRVAIDQLCEHHGVTLAYRVEPVAPKGDWGPAAEVVVPPFGPAHDACADPWISAPRWWLPVRLYETDFPSP